MRATLAIILSFIPLQLLADTVFPEGCSGVPLEEKAAVLKAKKPSLFMIYNQGDKDLWITHPVQNPGASAGWTTKLEPDHWSALTISKNFALSCVESAPGHEQEIACFDAIEVCQYKKAGFPKDTQAGYWVGENLPLKKLIAHVEKRGFQLPADTE